MTAPYTQRRFAQYRGPSNSDDYNKRVEENYRDLVALWNRMENSEIEMEEFFRRAAKNNISMALMVEHLRSRIETLEANNKRFTFYSADQIDTNNFNGDVEFSVAEEDKLHYDRKHGVLTLPKLEQSSMSKLIFLNSQGKEVKPTTLDYRVVGDQDTADNDDSFIDESPIEYAFYARPGLVWERNVVADAPHPDGATVTIYVAIPTDLFTTENSNAITLHPFPNFGCMVKEVSYTTMVDPMLRDSDGYTPINEQGYYAGEDEAVGWVAPGGWTGVNEGDDSATHLGPRIYYFQPKPVTAIKVVLHQPNYNQEGGKFVYTYGLSHLDLRFDKFLPEGRTMIRFDAPPGETISSVNSVEPQIWSVSPVALNRVFEYRTLWESSTESGIYTEEQQPNADHMWIEVTLKNTDKWVPALSGLIVDYS